MREIILNPPPARWVIELQPWETSPYGVYYDSGHSIPTVVARFETEALARQYCEQRLAGRTVAEYEIPR